MYYCDSPACIETIQTCLYYKNIDYCNPCLRMQSIQLEQNPKHSEIGFWVSVGHVTLLQYALFSSKGYKLRYCFGFCRFRMQAS